MVSSSESLVEYFDSRAATWEMAAYMKARPVAGDEAFGWRAIRSLDPIIYRSAMDFAGVASIREMKARIEAEKARAGARFDVKLGPGGIRDLEFVVQALQLLHGGRIPQVRHPSTQGGLAALAGAGVMPADEAEGLLESYRFLRRTENHLQMVDERQVHQLPPAGPALVALARSLGNGGDTPVADFEGDLERHRSRVRVAFESLLHRGGGEGILDLFARHVPRLLNGPATRGLIENLARRLAREVEASASPERALNNLDRFIAGVGGQTFYYGLLIDRPELVPRLAALFGASNYLSSILATRPHLIEPVFEDPNLLLPSEAQLRKHFAGIRQELGEGDDIEADLSALRRFVHRETVNVGLLDLGGKVDLRRGGGGAHARSRRCASRKGLAHRPGAAQLPGRIAPGDPRPSFLVVGMGKLEQRGSSPTAATWT